MLVNLSRYSLKILLLLCCRIILLEYIDKIFFVPRHILSHRKSPMVSWNNLVIDDVVAELFDEVIDIGFGNKRVKCAVKDRDRHINVLYREFRRVNLAVNLKV